jgi:cysteine synthase
MSLQGEIITAFVAALGTIGTTVGLVAYLLRDLRSEIQELRTETRAEIGELRTETRAEIGSVRAEIGELRTEMRSEIAGLRSDIRQVLVELLHHVQTGHHPPPQAA